MSLTSIEVKYSNSRITVNSLSERELGSGCADKIKITSRQTTVVPLRRLICANPGNKMFKCRRATSKF